MKQVTVPAGELAGLFKFEALKVDDNGIEVPGSRRVLADWFPNLITDNGLDLIGSSGSYLAYCQVGSGSATPANGNTSLGARIAGTNDIDATVTGAASSAPYFGWRRNTYRFAVGVAEGNIAEVGISPQTNGNLFSRALILDGYGAPTTITVLADEVLDVTYELRCYAPSVDWSDTVTISGVDYAIVGRAANANSVIFWGFESDGTNNVVSACNVYNGAIGSVTSTPSGTTGGYSTVSNAAYSASSLLKEATISWALGAGNLSGGISAILVHFGVGTYQFGITPAIPKTNTTVLDLTFRNSWSRKTL